MQDVAEAYTWDEKGQLAMWWGADPPNHLVEGMSIFRRSMMRTVADGRKKAREERERKAKAARG